MSKQNPKMWTEEEIKDISANEAHEEVKAHKENTLAHDVSFFITCFLSILIIFLIIFSAYQSAFVLPLWESQQTPDQFFESIGWEKVCVEQRPDYNFIFNCYDSCYDKSYECWNEYHNCIDSKCRFNDESELPVKCTRYTWLPPAESKSDNCITLQKNETMELLSGVWYSVYSDSNISYVCTGEAKP